MTYRYTAPFFLSLRLEFLEAAGVNTIGFFIQPESEERCRLYTTLWRDDLGGDPERMSAALDFEAQVLAEDLAIQEHIEDLALPLELSEELHTRADRTTVELRRVLADLVRAADAAAASAAGDGAEAAGAPGEDRGVELGGALQHSSTQ